MSWATASVVAPAAGFQMIESLDFNGLWLVLCMIGLIGSLAFWIIGKINQQNLK